ncbi:NTPase [Candidatus Rickettsia tasmanensis]
MKPSTSKSSTDKLRTLYSSHDTLPKLIEDMKIKAQSLGILRKITDIIE